MDRPRQQRFAGAAFAGHQHGRAAVGDGLRQIENLQHLVIVADDVLEPEPHFQLLAKRLIFEQQRLLANGLLDHDADFIIDDRLGEIVKGSHLGRLDGAFDRAVAGDDDGDHVRGAAAKIAEKFGGLDPRHVDVGQQDFDLSVFQNRQRLLRHVASADVVTLAAEELGQRLQDDAVLIEDENPRLMGRVGLEHLWFPPNVVRDQRLLLLSIG